ncbi:MAG: LPS export ABC transporter permease LptG [Pseudomonadota bacterium]
MRLIDQYFSRTVISSTATVLFVLLGVFSFFEFIDELEQVGNGEYRLTHVFVAVLFNLPSLAYELFPIGALIGSLLALAQLAQSNEIAVVRCAGVPKLRVIWSVMRAGFVLVVLALVIGEVLVPPAERFVRQYKSDLLASQRTGAGYWTRDGENYINVGEILPNDRLRDVLIYEFDDEQRLRAITKARTAVFDNSEWTLEGIEQSSFNNGDILATALPAAKWNSPLKPDLISLVAQAPEALSIFELVKYVGFLEGNGQSSARYRHALWVKIAYPLAAAVMVFLAIPMVMGQSSRTTSSGRQILVGGIIGLTFHVANQAAGHVGMVFAIPPAASALAPAIVLLAVGAVLNWRSA